MALIFNREKLYAAITYVPFTLRPMTLSIYTKSHPPTKGLVQQWKDVYPWVHDKYYDIHPYYKDLLIKYLNMRDEVERRGDTPPENYLDSKSFDRMYRGIHTYKFLPFLVE